MALPAITTGTLTDGGGGGKPTTTPSPLPVSFSQALLILKANAGSINQTLVMSEIDKQKLIATLTGKTDTTTTDNTTTAATNYVQYILAAIILFVIFKPKTNTKS